MTDCRPITSEDRQHEQFVETCEHYITADCGCCTTNCNEPVTVTSTNSSGVRFFWCSEWHDQNVY